MTAKTRLIKGVLSRRYRIRLTLAFGMLAIGVFFYLGPDLVGRHMNAVHSPGAAATEDVTLPADLFIADLHADTLLWNRDPLGRGSYGHVDLPRMLEAGIGLQVFSAVTKTPRGLNFERNDDSTDNVTLLIIAQRWPIRTWRSLTERALYQASRLHRLAERSAGQFIVVKDREDLARYRERRAAGAALTAGLLAIEGLHALEGDIHNLRRLHAAGFRMMGLTHFFDNAIGGSAHGIEKGGLTSFGRDAIAEMERLGIIIDLAHASPRLTADVLARATRPVVVSHTGVRGTCDRTRNLSDEQLRSIAANGGLVGIAYFSEAVCGNDIASIVAAIRYTVNVIGVRHVALGSDFDGAVTTPFDVTGVPRLGLALARSGFSQAEVRAILGGNVVDLLLKSLPDQ